MSKPKGYQKYFFVFFLFCIFSVSHIHAIPYPFFFEGGRQQGMGGTFVGLADNFDALYYNAAGLTNLKKNQFHFLHLNVQRGIKTKNLSGNREDIANNNLTSLYNAIKEGAGMFLSALTDQVGLYTHLYAWSSLFSYVSVWKHFSFAFSPYLRAQLLVNANDNFDPKTRVAIESDAGIFFGSGINISGVSLGMSVPVFVRYETDSIYNLSHLEDSLFKKDFKKNFLKSKKYHYATNFSFLWLVPLNYTDLEWRLGGSLDNFYSTAKDIRSLNIGSSIKLFLFDRYFVVSMVTDFRDVLYNSKLDESFGKRIHFGAEASHAFHSLYKVAVRLGMNQGYPSFGLGFDLGTLFVLDYALFLEELGAYSGHISQTRQTFEFKFYY